jgi:hypothetical protein
MRLAIIGSRGYPNKDFVRDYIDALPKDTIVVTGAWPARPGGYWVVEPTRGVDRMAYRFAEAAGLVTVLVAGSKTGKGRLAGIQRNPVIPQISEALVAFWDLKSSGTRGTLQMAFHAPHLSGCVRVFGPGGQEVDPRAFLAAG